jgi:dTDP-4-dehydrorhamnose reductase
MKILLTGASGMLAAEVIAQGLKLGHELVQTDVNPRKEGIEKLDITSSEEVSAMVKKHKPDFIYHLGALTNVDFCEQEPMQAYKVNTFGTENVALACLEYNLPLVYVSTVGVFYGDKSGPYTEFDAPRPKNVYGDSKLQGEIIVERLLSKYFIVRAGWMVGGWELDKKFVYKIVQQLKEGKTEIMAVSDKWGSPTFTKDFAANLFPLVDTRRWGLYHMTNNGVCSRHDIAVKIVELMGLKDKVKVMAVNSARFPLPAARADSEMVQNLKLNLLGLNRMPSWQESLKEYILLNKNKA